MSTTETITQIALEDLHESPFNPRKFFDDAYLAELAEDIKGHGRVLQPLLVRPRVPELFTGVEGAEVGYELVFGHCRLRAARLAGLTHAPCMVRSMSDQEVKRAQISENLQRKDVHPIEEAEGLQALIDDHGETPETLAVMLGGPTRLSYVYSRLKLLQACPKVREACLVGDVGAEVTLLIARLRTPKLQEQALSRITGKNLDAADGGKKSTREIRELLKEEFTLDLDKALFDPADFTLVESAGDCTSCTKRSGNAPEFADLTADRATRYGHLKGEPNLCTDPDCFASKKTAHLKREASKAEAEGARVIEGNKARAAIDAHGNLKADAYIPVSAITKAVKKAPGAAEALKQATVQIQDPRTGKMVQALEVKTLKAAGVPLAEPAVHKPSNNHQAERESQQQQAAKATAFNLDLLRRVRQAMATSERSTQDLVLVAEAALEGVRYDDRDILAELWACEEFDDISDKLPALNPDQLAQLALDCRLVKGVHVNWYTTNEPDALLATAARYGVPIEPEQTPEPEAVQAPANPAEAPLYPSTRCASSQGGSVRYRNPETGESWSGRGLQPKWLKAAIAAGKSLDDFDTQAKATVGNEDKEMMVGGGCAAEGSEQANAPGAGSHDAALRLALEVLDEIALAGMSGTGQESEEGLRDWHARQAWKFISIAAHGKDAVRAAIAENQSPAEGDGAAKRDPNSIFQTDGLPERDASKPAEQQGLFRKFIVSRTDGSDKPGCKHENCEYFVLDVGHDKHAAAALWAYAQACAETHPELAADLIERYELTAPKPQPKGVDSWPCPRCGIERDHFPACAQDGCPLMVNGLTEAETSETASVRGITQAPASGAVKWTDEAILSLLRRNGDGPFGEADILDTRRFMEHAEELRPELAAPSLSDALAKEREARRQAQSELALFKARLASSRLTLMRELQEQGWTRPEGQAPAVQAGTDKTVEALEYLFLSIATNADSDYRLRALQRAERALQAAIPSWTSPVPTLCGVTSDVPVHRKGGE